MLRARQGDSVIKGALGLWGFVRMVEERTTACPRLAGVVRVKTRAGEGQNTWK